ncbi:MAG: YybH family protein [Methylocella sp.]
MNDTERRDDEQIRALLETWAYATRHGQRDEILANHASDVVVFDVLPPLSYVGADVYRKSWDEWQPETEGPGLFEIRDLKITAGGDVAFAHGFIQCGGTLKNGRTFEDWVRATFCLRRIDSCWVVAHQHISMPIRQGDGKR